MIPTLIGISFIVFMMVRFLPGDVVDTILGETGSNDPELRAKLEEEYELTGNVPGQYVEWLGEVVRGDLGESLISGRSVLDEINHRAPASFELMIIAIIIGLIISVPIGVISAARQNSWGDIVGRSAAIGFLAIPGFWLGTLVITLPSRWWGWSPPLEYKDLFEDPASNLELLIIPGIILALPFSGTVMRLTRAQLLEVLRQDYVRTARAKGLRESNVVTRHALRNALIPVVTVVGLQVPVLLGGVVIMENIFGIPGIGSYIYNSILSRDYTVVQAVNLLIAVLVLVINLLVDVMYGYLDPRIRYS